MVVTSSLPPNNPEICNDGWMHAAFCLDCAPMTPTLRAYLGRGEEREERDR